MFYKSSDLGEFPVRHDVKQVSIEMLEVCQKSFYVNKKGEKVDIHDQIKFSVDNSRAYVPEYHYTIPPPPENANLNNIEFTKETTIGAGYRLVVQEHYDKTVALNFANGVEQGGGWIRGAKAQEEAIVRCSSLILSLKPSLSPDHVKGKKPDDITINGKQYKRVSCMYHSNRQFEQDNYEEGPLSTDYQLLNPDVVVFRDDQFNFLDEPFKLSFITSPACYARGYYNVAGRTENSIQKVNSVMLNRIRKIILLAIEEGYECIILGAYGCGAFGNNSSDVAKMFHKVLVEEGLQKYFKKITFPIFEPIKGRNTYELFSSVFQ